MAILTLIVIILIILVIILIIKVIKLSDDNTLINLSIEDIKETINRKKKFKKYN